MKTIDISEALENMIDLTSVKDILHEIESICSLKATHVAENWQDENLADD